MELYQDDVSVGERLETGQKIREIRNAKGYPAWIVARLCDLNEETLRRYEAGERWPGFDTAMKLAAVLGVALDDFLPDGFFERHTPPQRLLEQLGELLKFPVGTLAEDQRGTSNRRSKRAASGSSNRKASKATQRPRKARTGRTAAAAAPAHNTRPVPWSEAA